LAVRTRMGIIEHRGSSAQAVLFQAKTQARGMIAMGMAFGISPAHQAYGQVLGSESIFPYDKREVVDSESGPVSDYSKTKRRLASPTLLAMLKSEINREARAFSVSLGLLLSGGARISSGQFRDSLASQIPDGPHPVIGGDMEGVGLLSVSPSDDPRWVVVKGISDFAEGKSSTTDVSMRETACRNAVRLVLSAILHEGNS
jgi:nucleoside phosphorylase